MTQDLSTLTYAAALVLLAVLAGALIVGGRRKGGWSWPGAEAPSPYGPKPLLSGWERRALLSLRQQIPTGFYVCPQVRLADMLIIPGNLAGGRTAALNRVSGKSVDFAIVRLDTGRVELVVELDDRSHAVAARRERDRFVNKVLETAGIPIIRFTPHQRLDVRDRF